MAGEKYKLTYLNFRGRVEGIRFMFHYAGVPFEDARVDRQSEEWKTLKPTLPSQQLPILEIIQADGKAHVLSQTMAIVRYLARQFSTLKLKSFFQKAFYQQLPHHIVYSDLDGDNSLESAQMDEIVATLMDAAEVAGVAYYEPDPVQKAKLYEQVNPAKIGFVERKLNENGGKFLVGNRYSWADFYVAAMLREYQDYAGPSASGSESALSNLTAWAKTVYALPPIAAYIANRPVTIH